VRVRKWAAATRVQRACWATKKKAKPGCELLEANNGPVSWAFQAELIETIMNLFYIFQRVSFDDFVKN
jgi:hypothetical protein